MLAIKTVMAKKDDIETLIFDEIDVGISGRTAQKVSEKMALIGNVHQVICITHLAQIAPWQTIITGLRNGQRMGIPAPLSAFLTRKSRRKSWQGSWRRRDYRYREKKRGRNALLAREKKKSLRGTE